MTFHEIVSVLNPYCGKGQKNSDFVVTLIDNFMEETEDCVAGGVVNPLLNLVPRTLENYFNGSRPIGHINAKKILSHIDKDRFASYIDVLPVDALMAIAKTLMAKGISVTESTLSFKCADLMEEALLLCIKGVSSPTSASADTCDTSMEVAMEITSNPTTLKNRFVPLKVITPPPDVTEQEIPYVMELMAAYGDAEGISEFTKDILKQHEDKYGEHFKRQRRDFYAAESIRQGTREAYGETDPDQFEILKDETYDGVVDVWEQDHRNGFMRLNKVLAQASQIRIDRCWLCRDTDWIGNSQKKGVCHILVNEGRIKGWIKKNG
jgi:hypothetical protein